MFRQATLKITMKVSQWSIKTKFLLISAVCVAIIVTQIWANHWDTQ